MVEARKVAREINGRRDDSDEVPWKDERNRIIFKSKPRVIKGGWFANDCIYDRYYRMDIRSSFPNGISPRQLFKAYVQLASAKRNACLKANTVILPTDNWTAGYFHWITDVLCRVVQAGRITGYRSVLASECVSETS